MRGDISAVMLALVFLAPFVLIGSATLVPMFMNQLAQTVGDQFGITSKILAVNQVIQVGGIVLAFVLFTLSFIYAFMMRAHPLFFLVLIVMVAFTIIVSQYISDFYTTIKGTLVSNFGSVAVNHYVDIMFLNLPKIMAAYSVLLMVVLFSKFGFKVNER